MQKAVLVTGGAGFIGSHLVDALIARGDAVTVIDDESSGHKENLAQAADRITYVKGSITDRQLIADVSRGIDTVFHLAALGSVPRSVADPERSHDVNATGTLNVLWAAKEAGVRRLVFSSSSSVYGDNPKLPKCEEDMGHVLSPYALQKKMAEEYTLLFSRLYGMQTAAVRFFNIFGPRQDPNSQYAAVIPKFIKAMKAGERPQVYGDGTNSRAFTYVSDAVAGTLAAAEKAEAVGEAMNIGGSARTSLLELVKELNTILGTHLEPEFLPPRAGDIPHSMSDSAKAERLIGYRPQVSFADGLRKTVASFNAHL